MECGARHRRRALLCHVAASLVATLAATTGCGNAGSCSHGAAPLGATCGSDCACATANCNQGRCLPRVAWAATYLCDTSSNVGAVADTADGLFVSGMFVGSMDVDPTEGVKKISATVEYLPFATALTRDGTMLWGDPLPTTPTVAGDANPTAVRVAQPDGANVVLGLGDPLYYVNNAWRIDPATGQLQIPDVHLHAADFDVQPDTGDIVAVDHSATWAIDRAGQEISRTYAPGDRVRVDPTGGAIVAGELRGVIDIDPGPGTTNYTPMEQDIQVTKVDADGVNWSWRTVMGGQGSHSLGDLAVGGDGTIYVVGDFGGTIDTAAGTIAATDPSDAFAAALNPDGTIRWLTPLGAEGGFSILPLPDGNVLLGGYGDLALPGSPPPPGNGQISGFLMELDGAGHHVWSAYTDLPAGLHLGADGALYVYGSINGNVVDATAFRGGMLRSYGNDPLHYESGIVVKMVIR